MTHERVIRHAIGYIQTFSKKAAAEVEALFGLAKAQRELIDYNAPSGGDAELSDLKQFLGTCRMLAEFAQFNSELLERSFEKYTEDKEFQLIDTGFRVAVNVKIEGHDFVDQEDLLRIGYFARKHPRLTSIQMMVTDGHIEDFFGAWGEEEPGSQNFNPDLRWNAIFDI